VGALAIRPCQDACVKGVAFDIPEDELDAYLEREHRYNAIQVECNVVEPSSKLLCWTVVEQTDDEYLARRLDGSQEEWNRRVGQYYKGAALWGRKDILPLRTYLTDVVLAASTCGDGSWLVNLLDDCVLANEVTTIREYLLEHSEERFSSPSLKALLVSSSSTSTSASSSVQLCEEANENFRANDMEQAVNLYSKALVLAQAEANNEVKIRVLLNRSHVYLRQQWYEDAVADTSAVLAMDPCNVKALLRRAKAFEYLGRFEEGLVDVSKAREGDLSPSLKCSAALLNSTLRTLLSRDNKVRESESRPERLVTKEQTLRLVFLCSLPSVVRVGEVISVRLCIGNEFGLWDRSNMLDDKEGKEGEEPAVIRVCCEVATFPLSVADSDASSCAQQTQTRCSAVLLSSDVVVGPDGKANIELVVQKEAESFGGEADAADVGMLLKFSLDQALPSGALVRPVLSLPIKLASSSASSSSSDDSSCNTWSASSIGSSLYPSCIRSFLSEAGPVYAFECPGQLGIGGKIWDGSFVLLEYFSTAPGRALIRDKVVLELGSGTGLAGIMLCSFDPARIILTDMQDVSSLLSANVELNAALIADPALRNKVKNACLVETHAWGELPFPPSFSNAQLIVCSDVVYDPALYTPLAITLAALLCGSSSSSSNGGGTESAGSDEAICCIMAHRSRHPEEETFFSALRNEYGIAVEEIARGEERDPGTAALQDVRIFKFTKQKA